MCLSDKLIKKEKCCVKNLEDYGKENGIERGWSSKLYTEVVKESYFSTMQGKTLLEVRTTKEDASQNGDLPFSRWALVGMNGHPSGMQKKWVLSQMGWVDPKDLLQTQAPMIPKLLISTSGNNEDAKKVQTRREHSGQHWGVCLFF